MEILIILVLILLNGVFSMSEIALLSSKKIRLEAAAKAGKPGAATALQLAESPNYFLSTVQIGITLIGLLTGIYSGKNITTDLEQYFERFDSTRAIADGLAVAIVLISITFFSLILGELVPKRIGLTNPEGISRVLAPFMKLLSKITLPFVWVLTHTSDIILKVLNVRARTSNITEEEIKAIIHEGTQGGEIQEIEQDIVERVFVLGDRNISSLMTTRGDLTFLDVNSSFEELQETVNKDLHRIYPVYRKDKDRLLGVVRLKDLFVAFQKPEFDIMSHLKPANYLVETTSAYRALENFKKSKVHYALVTNEYGMVIGIITIDDILKALVGDVAEFYSEDYQLTKREDGSYIVDGQYPLSEFVHYFDIDDSKEVANVNTIAGLILNELHQIPKTGDTVRWNDLEFEVVDMDNIKIDKVLVRRVS